MTDLFDEPDGATLLTPDERQGLIQTSITYRHELNVAEQDNIAHGVVWARNRRQRNKDILTEEFIKQLHHKMFGKVWLWAGQYRQTERNIGIDALRIPIEIRTAFDDVRYWLENETFVADEIAVRFHHRVVAIHPFPNGNGRTSRFLADLLIERMGGELFSWGRANLIDVCETRSEYIKALKAADQHDLTALLLFARS